MGSKGNTVMLDEFRALLEKSLTNKTDRYWLDQVGLEINDENDLCIIVSSDFIKSAIEKKVYSKIKSLALKEKQLNLIQKWMDEKIESTYVNVNKDSKICSFANNWIKK